ncbi:MAG: hypothetical protein AB8V23_00335 [Candidatus Midichloria sp.]
MVTYLTIDLDQMDDSAIMSVIETLNGSRVTTLTIKFYKPKFEKEQAILHSLEDIKRIKVEVDNGCAKLSGESSIITKTEALFERAKRVI